MTIHSASDHGYRPSIPPCACCGSLELNCCDGGCGHEVADIVEGSFMEFAAGESYVSPRERDWLRWVKRVEKIVGREIDGDEGDGICLDYAHDAFCDGLTPEEYVAEPVPA